MRQVWLLSKLESREMEYQPYLIFEEAYQVLDFIDDPNAMVDDDLIEGRSLTTRYKAEPWPVHTTNLSLTGLSA